MSIAQCIAHNLKLAVFPIIGYISMIISSFIIFYTFKVENASKNISSEMLFSVVILFFLLGLFWFGIYQLEYYAKGVTLKGEKIVIEPYEERIVQCGSPGWG